MECPVTTTEIMSLLIQNKFRPLSDKDLDAYGGVEYTGYTYETDDYVIIVDHGPGGYMVNVIAYGDPESSCWMVEIMAGAELEQIV